MGIDKRNPETAAQYPALVYLKVIKGLNPPVEDKQRQALAAIRRNNLIEVVRTLYNGKKADFARAIDRAPAQVNNILNEKQDKFIGAELARDIESKLGLAPGFLDSTTILEARGAQLRRSAGEDPHLHSNLEPAESSHGSRLPLISWVSAGLKDDANDPYAPGNAEAWIEFDSPATNFAFCLRVRGESMVRPDGTGFPDGSIIAVEPKRRPKSGEFAVFRFNNSDEATFKQYYQDGPLRMLRPLNPSYPMIALGPDAQLVGTVFEKRIIEKF